LGTINEKGEVLLGRNARRVEFRVVPGGDHEPLERSGPAGTEP
jgi:hypothetical protein